MRRRNRDGDGAVALGLAVIIVGVLVANAALLAGAVFIVKAIW